MMLVNHNADPVLCSKVSTMHGLHTHAHTRARSPLLYLQIFFTKRISLSSSNRLVSWDEYLREQALYILAARPNCPPSDNLL